MFWAYHIWKDLYSEEIDNLEIKSNQGQKERETSCFYRIV